MSKAKKCGMSGDDGPEEVRDRSLPTTFKEKYVAIKLHALWPWLWFDTTKVTEKNGTFVGKGGWGRGGALTEVSIDTRLIVGRVESDTLQYSDE